MCIPGMYKFIDNLQPGWQIIWYVIDKRSESLERMIQTFCCLFIMESFCDIFSGVTLLLFPSFSQMFPYSAEGSGSGSQLPEIPQPHNFPQRPFR